LEIAIVAEVDGIRRDYEVTFIRRGANNATVGFAHQVSASLRGAGTSVRLTYLAITSMGT
jgi:hypothetical protein